VAGDLAWAIVVAAGAGRRFGTTKQFELLEGRSVVSWSVLACRSVCAGVVLVVPGENAGDADLLGLADRVVPGGSTRAESVRAGIAALPAEASFVLVHDAARPLASPELFRRVLVALVEGASAVIPGVPLADTVKRVAVGVVTETLPRDELVAVQTPQGFRTETLRRAHLDEAEATDDAALVERQGVEVRVVPGEPDNLKLTTPADMERAAGLIAKRSTN
jgi:2-C-methyl-D-erythritol 4-phosphate cytidylyltransferase